jgi:hypothetical protein
MLIDQFLRRLLWRARRKVRPGADNEPIVSVEAPPPPPVANPKPRRRDRWRRAALGFVATFAVLAVGYAFLVAANSRAPLDAGFVAPLDAGGSRATAAAAALLSLGASEPAVVADDLLIIPNGRRLRTARIHAGAAEAAAAYVDLLVAAASPPDSVLGDAREALTAGDPAAARDALLLHNNRVARGRADPGSGPARVALLAETAAAACERESAMLRETAAAEQGWMASPRAQAQVSHARGVAFGWLLLLRGALADAPDVASTTVVEAAIPLDALAAAAERQPLFLFNGGPEAPWSPAHLIDHADDFARAAAGARALADAARAAAPPG